MLTIQIENDENELTKFVNEMKRETERERIKATEEIIIRYGYGFKEKKKEEKITQRMMMPIYFLCFIRFNRLCGLEKSGI